MTSNILLGLVDGVVVKVLDDEPGWQLSPPAPSLKKKKKNQERGVVSPAFEDRDRKFPAQAEWLDQQNWRRLALVKEFTTLGNRVGIHLLRKTSHVSH